MTTKMQVCKEAADFQDVDVSDIIEEYNQGRYDENMACDRIAVRMLLACPCR